MAYGNITKTTEEINALLDKVEQMEQSGGGLKEIEITENEQLPADPNVVIQMQLVDNPSEIPGVCPQASEIDILKSSSEKADPDAKMVITLDNTLPGGVSPNETASVITQVTVGATGTYKTLGAALAALSRYSVQYKQGGIECSATIQRGTVIKEQILVRGIDLSYITIYYEGHKTTANVDSIMSDYASVLTTCAVDATGWTGATHDTRDDVCLFRAEDGGRLPQIACIFELINSGNKHVCGMLCNKGSWGLVASGCGFIKFWDGVIANNESSITIREGIASFCNRWGCHARHNGEVSARSVIAVGCGTDPEGAGVCADRVANLDARKAYVSANANSVKCFNCSMLNANEVYFKGSGQATITATAVGIINCVRANGANMHFVVQEGGQIATAGCVGTKTFSKKVNTVDNNGIIYN